MQRSIRCLLAAMLILAMALSGCSGGGKTGGSGNTPKSGNSGGNAGGNSGGNSGGNFTPYTPEDASKLVPLNGDDGIAVTDTKTKTANGILVAGDTGYEMYGFSQGIADQYINCVKKANQALGGTANIYDMVIPTAMDTTMPDALRKTVKSGDQREGS